MAAAAAWFVTRWGVAAFGAAMRYHLGLVSAEAGGLYRGVEA